MNVIFSHRELSLALFALEGGELPASVEDPCSPDEHACPVVESLEEMFGMANQTPEKKLAQHLVKHLQQGWIECGLMDLGQPDMTQPGRVPGGAGLTASEDRRNTVDGQGLARVDEHSGRSEDQMTGEQQLSASRMARSLSKWNCEIELAQEERRLLSSALSRLPRSAWISMPRTMWRLRRKLKD
jgi:hypothetical protein